MIGDPKKLKPWLFKKPAPGMMSDRWLENSQTRRMLPDEIDRILVDGLGGDLTDQYMLFNMMLDTWPVLQRNVRTLRDAVKSAPWEVHAFCEDDGTEITDSAQEKASLVSRALWGTTPHLPALELTFEDLCGAQAIGSVMGHAVHQILWEVRPDVLGTAILPRAFKRVGTQHYGYPLDMNGERDRLLFREGWQARQWMEFPEQQFITGIYPGHEGHPSVAAPLRSLAMWWIAARFGPEWLLSYSQVFGQPIRWANYKRGDDKAKVELGKMLANIGSNAWGAFPEGTKIEFLESTRGAGELPQKLIIEMADMAANILVLGQTLTSAPGSEGGGSYALGQVHQGVRREILSSCAAEVAKVLTIQLAKPIVRLNYGDDAEAPEIRCELPEPKDAKAEAERDKVLVGMGMKLPLQWLHDRHGVPMPEKDEDVLGGETAKVEETTKDTKGAKEEAGEAEEETIGPDGKPVKAGRVVVDERFREDLTDIHTAVLEHAAARGFMTSQINLGALDDAAPENQ